MPNHPLTSRISLTLRILFYAYVTLTPLCYGATPFWASALCAQIALFLFAVWFLFKAATRSLPAIPLLFWLPASLILIQGWWMVFNGHSTFDTAYQQFVPLLPPFPELPGSVDKYFSGDVMLRISGLLASAVLAIHFGKTPQGRMTLLRCMAIGAVLVVILGFLQRASGASDIFWGDRNLTQSFFFGPYRYHGNAGAFLNFTWPLIVCTLVICWTRQKSSADKAIAQFWGIAVLLSTIALFINGSRAASILAVPLILGGLFSYRRWLKRNFKISKSLIIITLVISAFSISVLSFSFMGKTADRWSLLLTHPGSLFQRLDTYHACLPMIQDGGWFGFGPGGFRWSFPEYAVELQKSSSGFWRFAHQDYLQTLIEWGMIGTLWWAMLFVPVLVRLNTLLKRLPGDLASGEHYMLRALALSILGLILYAMGDFPLQIYSIQLYLLTACSLIWSMHVGKSVSQKTA